MDLPTSPADDARAMMLISDRLADPRVQQFFSVNRHKQAATRALLEVLGIPLPKWAQRSPSGRAARHKAALDRFQADNLEEALLPAATQDNGVSRITRLIQQRQEREAAEQVRTDELAAIYASGRDPLESA